MNGQRASAQRHRLHLLTRTDCQLDSFFGADQRWLQATGPIDQRIDKKRKTGYYHQAHHVNRDLEKNKPR